MPMVVQTCKWKDALPPHRLQWWECATCARLSSLVGPRPGAGNATARARQVCKLRRPMKWTRAGLEGMQGPASCGRRSSGPPCSPAKRGLPTWETACSEWCVLDAQDSTRTLLWKQDVGRCVRQTGPSPVSRICASVQ